jgi:hypothetical protein
MNWTCILQLVGVLIAAFIALWIDDVNGVRRKKKEVNGPTKTDRLGR